MTDPISADAPACSVCQHVPAADATFYQVTGVLVYLRWIRAAGPFCRDCGTSAFRDATAASLAGGVWHVLSPVLVPLVLARNLAARRRVTALPEPVPHPLTSPNHRPLVPGRPVFRRPASWLAPAVLAGLVALAPLAATTGGPRHDQVGGCVARSSPMGGMFDSVRYVSCADRHDARITAVVTDWSACADHDGYVAAGGRFFCLTDDPTTPAG